jgi:hypothetical protein
MSGRHAGKDAGVPFAVADLHQPIVKKSSRIL